MGVPGDLGLTGTKYGCGEAQCGACTVLVNDQPVRSCVTPVKDIQGARVVTIEGLAVAVMAEVTVDRRSGSVVVKRVVCAQDMGIVVNPEGARQQIEGCIMMGLGYTLSEELQFRNGRILNDSFGRYELPRFSWLPAVEPVIIESTAAAQGGGEPAIVPVGAAVASAVCDATGARLLHMPFTPRRVRAALVPWNRDC